MSAYDMSFDVEVDSEDDTAHKSTLILSRG